MKQKKLFKFSALLLALVMAFGITAFFAYADDTQFTDVTESDYYYDAVIWAAEDGITNGVGDNRYDPAGEVTRAQIVTFLWRMAGEPVPTNGETFTDVETGSWYETAVQWAVEQGITNGTGDNLFSPDLTCDRAMCLTLLYRMMGAPLDEAAAAEPVELTEDITLEELGIYMMQQMIEMYRDPRIFPDVEQGAYYELAVVWGGMSGILTDDNTGTMEEGVLFRPVDPCVRAEMISFLYQTKLMQDAANAPELYELGDIKIAIPQEYSELVFRNVYDFYDDDDGLGIGITISERASREAAEAMGDDPDEDGAGELFSIGRISEERLHEMLCSDMSGAEVFAKDENGKYYVFYHPTDVRYVRETNEQMEEDQEQWTKLNEWAYGVVRSDIIQYSDGLTPVTFSNTSLDINLARAAYQEGTKYTVSTTEYGPLEPNGADAAPYVEFLLGGNFVEAVNATAPDGECVVLSFPDEDVRYDFFVADGNLVREVRGEYETFYERTFLDLDISNTEAMQGWYNAIAEKAGKKDSDKSLDAFIGTWDEKIAGRGMVTISESAAPKKAVIKATWPDSAAVEHAWIITAALTEDGGLSYENGIHTVTEYDEIGEGRVIAEATDESGTFTISDEGELLWHDDNAERDGDSAFIRSDER